MHQGLRARPTTIAELPPPPLSGRRLRSPYRRLRPLDGPHLPTAEAPVRSRPPRAAVREERRLARTVATPPGRPSAPGRIADGGARGVAGAAPGPAEPVSAMRTTPDLTTTDVVNNAPARPPPPPPPPAPLPVGRSGCRRLRRPVPRSATPVRLRRGRSKRLPGRPSRPPGPVQVVEVAQGLDGLVPAEDAPVEVVRVRDKVVVALVVAAATPPWSAPTPVTKCRWRW